MSQAEIAGGQTVPPNQLPAKGYQFRHFTLPCVDGGEIRLSDYRGRFNLVLVFTDGRPETASLLSEMTRRYGEFKNSEAEILVVAQLTSDEALRMKERVGLPCPVLVDEDGRIHREVGASDSQENPAAAVYVTDRFEEIFGAYRTSEGEPLPTAAEVLNWLEFVNSQCPECEPPEWPL